MAAAADGAAAAAAAAAAPESADVLVIGGGLGGLALCAALQRLGRSWLLAEAAPELRTSTGTLIGIGDNGIIALQEIDPRIVDGIKELSQLSVNSEAHYRPAPGEGESETTLNPMASALHTIRWAATQGVLASVVDHGNVRCNRRCVGLDLDGDAEWVTARFAAGAPDLRARLVVGADGVRSAVRRALVPDDVGPRYLGFMNWNALREVPGSSAAPNSDTIKVVTDKKGGGFRTSCYVINAGCDHVFWQVRMREDGAPRFTNGAHGGGGVPGSKARVLERLREHGWDDVAAEVEATPEEAIFERALWDRTPLESWSSPCGRVALLGDAAHGMYPGPGLGARSAFEDAHQLMLALGARWPDVRAVVDQYEGARITRAAIFQVYAASMANVPALSKGFAEFWAARGAAAPPAKGANGAAGAAGASGNDGGDNGGGDGDNEQAAKGEQQGQAQAQEQEQWAALRERFFEFQTWVNSYPEHPRGLPGAKYTSPETLAAYLEHCRAVTAAESARTGRNAAGDDDI